MPQLKFKLCITLALMAVLVDSPHAGRSHQAAASTFAINPHPRIWITPSRVNIWKAKACLNPDGTRISACTPDPDYTWVKNETDMYLANNHLVFTWTITNCTNARPMVCTTLEDMSRNHWTSASVYFGGATGPWTAINTPNTRVGHSATYVDAHHFAVTDVDASTFGPYTRQNVVTFWKNVNGLSGYIVNSDYVGSGWYYFAEECGIMYYISGDPKYKDAALTLLNYINTLEPVSILAPLEPTLDRNNDGGYGSRFIMPAVSFIFDWFYPFLSQAQKNASVATLGYWYRQLGKGDATSSYQDITGFSPTAQGNKWDFSQGNFWGGHILGGGLAGYATYGDNPTDSGGSNAWIDAIRNSFDTWFVANADNEDGQNAGGQALESYNYGTNHWTRLLQYMYAVKTATDEDITTTWGPVLAKSQFYNLKPDRWQANNWGTFPGDTVGVMPGLFPMVAATILDGTSAQTTASEMQWLYTHFHPCPGVDCSSLQSGGHVDRMFWYNPNIQALDYRTTLPLYFISPGDWHVFTRTDWTDNAVWASAWLEPQHKIDHEDHIAGHIDVQRGQDHLIVDSGEWAGGQYGIYGSPGNGSNESMWASTLYFCDGGAYTFCNSPGYRGGQGTNAPYLRPKTIGTSNYVYASNDLSGAYRTPPGYDVPSKRTLLYWFRTFLSYSDGTITVQDLVRASQPGYTKNIRWQLNPANPPVVDSGIVSQVVGSSKIFILPIYPIGASITVAQNTDQQPHPVLTYRVDVTNATPSTDLNALTVLYPTSSQDSLPQAVGLSQISPHFMGVQIAGLNPKVAVLPSAVVAKDRNTYSLESSSTVSFTTTHTGMGSYVVAGLDPGQYNVIGPCASDCEQTVGADGTLYFTGTSGHYTVARSFHKPLTRR